MAGNTVLGFLTAGFKRSTTRLTHLATRLPGETGATQDMRLEKQQDFDMMMKSNDTFDMAEIWL